MVKIVMIWSVLWCFFPVAIEAKEYGDVSRLDKNWELYWHQLLEPADFRDKKIAYDKKQTFPFFWSKIEINGQTLPAKGFLTLRKVIQIPDSLAGKTYGLRVPEMFSAYKLFVNGDLKATNGTVSDRLETYQPHWRPHTITFMSHQKEIELVLQIANFSYKLGGSWRSIEFGLAEKINDRTNLMKFMALFLFASVFTMGCYHISLYLKRTQSFAALYFSLLCAAVALRTMVSGEMLIYHFLNPNWDLLLKLNFMTVTLIPPLFVKFQQHMFRDCSHKRIANAFMFIGLLCTLTIIIFPARIHSLFLDFYHLVGMLNGVYIVFVFMRAISRKRNGATISLLAFLILFFAGINDILAVNNLIVSEQMFPIGLIVFFIAQSFMLAQKFSNALNREEILSQELEDLNECLEEKVEERTAELKQAVSEITQLSGLLPICASCKKVRDDKGYWNQIEEYLSEHSDAVFSHSMCPHCMQEMYPELTDQIEMN